MQTFSKPFMLITALLVLLFVTACEESSLSDTGHKTTQDGSRLDMTAEEIFALIESQPDTVILDIRTPKEYHAGHIENAKLVDFYSDNFREQLDLLAKDKTYVVYCRSGGRSGKSMAIFEELGFESIAHLKTGFNGWQASNLPIQQ